MDWSETLFQKAWNILARVAQKAESNHHAVSLNELKTRLGILAALLTGESIEIVSAEAEGGYTQNAFFLPRQIQLFPDREQNVHFYLFRVVFLAAQRALNLNWPDGEPYALEKARQQAAQHAPQVLAHMNLHYPGVEQFLNSIVTPEIWEQEVEAQALFWGHWMQAPSANSAKTQTPTPQQAKQDLPETTLDAPSKENIEVLEKDSKAIQNYTLQHYFEKVETLEAFQGTWRETNGDDDLADHAEALNELDLRQVMRSDDPVHSIYQAEFLLNTTTPESKDSQTPGFFLNYDEWDGKKRRYRKDFCRVFPQLFQKQQSSYYQKTLQAERQTLNQLRVRLGQFFNELETVRRQRDGERLDFDALVENFADRCAGFPPSERVYLSRRKRQREIAVLILLDLSLSTDAFTAGRRVIDVEKQAVILFAELLSEYGDLFQIDGFSSRTRNHCDYFHIKRFEEHWGQGAKRVGALEPCGYTRIGPALRHATQEIKKQQAQQKWILLLSDGKPNDYDRYEGKYGMQDVRQAIREAEQERIHCFALAVESAARHYLPPMLGEGRYQILPRPQELPQALTQFYTRLIYSLN